MRSFRTPGTFVLLACLAAVVALPRLIVLPFNENLYGDAIPRTELAERWMGAPHVITAFGDGAGQYGPLHLYLVALATAVADREDAGRIIGLLFGVLSVIPLFLLSRRLLGWEAGVVASLAFSAWGLHVQFSTTAASEGVSVFLMLAALAAFAAGLDSSRSRHFVVAAVCLNLAAAVRYDPWMYVVLLPASVALTRRANGLSPGRAAAFGAMCLPFPLVWMAGNQSLHGDPLYPLRYIDAEHAAWAGSLAGGWGEAWLRAQGIVFWPAMALVSLTPGVALLAAVGMASAWRDRSDGRWLTVVIAAPLVYFAVRTTVLFDFVPLARYMATSLALMLIFVREGYVVVARRWPASRARLVMAATIAMALVIPTAVGALTFRADGVVANVLRPISPVTTNPRAVMHAAAVVRSAVVEGGRTVAVDSDAGYLDLTLVFFSRLTDDRVVRVRWPAFASRFDAAPPDFVVRFDRGSLARTPGVDLLGPVLTVRGVSYVEVGGLAAPVHLYRRQADSMVK